MTSWTRGGTLGAVAVLAGTVLIRAQGAAPVAPQAAPQTVDYVRDIQPIFEKYCADCHGRSKARAQLRLHAPEWVRKGGQSGPIVIAGNSHGSELMRRILDESDEDRMPLDTDPLPAPEVAKLRAWIDQGATMPAASAALEDTIEQHWAYVRPKRPATPELARKDWARNPIDAFVLARLEREQLSPSPEAAKTTLLRRVSFDLIGLPPRPEEVDAFVADHSPDAYEKVVDRLLASPHFGERWARPWLDLARYADTNGYEKDNRREIWKYRDWVINAFNRDLPFDRFTIEQIAGDMLPEATIEQKIATGFHRNAMTNEEGGVDPEESRYEVLVDRANTTATVWLGSTLACAQCHNHKYDPFTQKDYFRLLSFFANNDYDGRAFGDGTRYFEPTLELATPEQEAARKELQAHIERLDQQLKTATPELTAAQKTWEESLRAAWAGWTAVTPVSASATNGVTLRIQPDGSVLASGVNAAATTYTVSARVPLAGITGLRIEALPDASLPRGGPGRDGYGHFRVTGLHVQAGFAPVQFRTMKVDESAASFDPAELLGGKPAVYARKGGSWAINAMRDTAERLPRNAVLAVTAPLPSPAGAELKVTIDHLDGTIGQGIGRFRLWVTDRADPLEGADLAPRLRKVLDVPASARSTAQSDELAALFRATTPLLKETREALASQRKALADLKIPSTLIMRERPGFERPSFELRVRGSFSAKGERVYAGTPRALHPMRDELPSNRLGLARWLVDPNNPLVARVVVNRLWEQLFGRGLVETSEDFGSQGAPPTHPDLLDWLATELVAKGWSQKTLLKTIVMSATYRQSSAAQGSLAERDPYNRLFARGPRVRLEAEMIRDATLAASGLLSDKMFGPSVFPVQPDGIWNMPYNSDKWTASSGEDRFRRSLYTFWRRTSPYPSFMTFDATSREFCTVRRVRTNTPLQALTLLNDPAAFEAARALARRMVSGGSTAAERAAWGVKQVLSRPAERSEIDRLVVVYEKESASYRQRGDADADLSAWTLVANVLLNLDEAITKE